MNTYWFRCRVGEDVLTFGVEAEDPATAERRLRNDDPCWFFGGKYFGPVEPPAELGEIRAEWSWRDTSEDVGRQWPEYMRQAG